MQFGVYEMTADKLDEAAAFGLHPIIIVNGEYYGYVPKTPYYANKIKVYDGYEVYTIREKRKCYVQSFRNGKYTFCVDHTYAKHFSEKTANRHIKALRTYTETPAAINTDGIEF